MTPLILGVDSGLDGAFAWWSVGRIVKSVATRTIVRDRRIDMDALEDYSADAIFWAESLDSLRIAYIEEPFNNGVSGGASTSGYTDQCKRWGRLQGWLESWGYEVKGVQAKTWQREILDLGRFEVRTEKACAPRLADGWTMTRIKPTRQWRVRGPYAIDSAAEGVTRQDAIEDLGRHMPGAILRTKTVLSHDTKAASVAYVREHFPGVDLVPPRSKKPHDGLADAVCIAAWASKQKTV
jgi:hypothetical protein